MSHLRSIPSIDRMLQAEPVRKLCDRFGRTRVTQSLRQVTAAMRSDGRATAPDEIFQRAQAVLEAQERPSLKKVINATGVILHTNLGRSPLAPAALEQILECSGYSNLELDLRDGERGYRYEHVTGLLCQLSGAAAALVVNNCAAAMMLIVEVLARGKEVIVSRGELVEIGGSFRVPDILARGGARLAEVGTTNRTRIDDYRRAIGPDTGLILSTHLSNFVMSGFVESPRPQELVALGREHGVATCLDLGSGLLRPNPNLSEPSVVESVAAGFDVIAFSGDKLLGATQSGIVLGRTDLVEKLSRDPLQRALRVDKLTLAGLEATLRLYLDPARAQRDIPVLAMIDTSLEQLKSRGNRLARRLRKAVDFPVTLQAGQSSVGGGSTPGSTLPTWLVAVQVGDEEDWASRLRQGQPAILARRARGALLLDVRTLAEEDLVGVERAFAQAHSL